MTIPGAPAEGATTPENLRADAGHDADLIVLVKVVSDKGFDGYGGPCWFSKQFGRPILGEI